jgi:putative transposase
MTNIRNVVLANDQIYRVFNRSIDRQTIFKTRWEYKRALATVKYYRFLELPIKFSQLLNLSQDLQEKIIKELVEKDEKLVEIIAFCFMPNHFHFLLKQLQDKGISKFIANFSNSYTKYFNTKHERKGHLFEGLFKAVRVESDEQLIHLSRYIHLNPTSSFIIKNEDLEHYEWSSLPEYLEQIEDSFCNKSLVLSYFSSIKEYGIFLKDQINYAQQLDRIKHLTLEL